MHWRHEQLSLRMALAAATHHSAQPRGKKGVEGETNDAPRRPKPPLPGKRPAPPEEVAEPQEKLGQHSGIGCELVLALDAPVLHVVEQPVDVLVRVDELLKKQEEEEVRRLLWTSMNQLIPLQQKKALEHFQAETEEEEEEESSENLFLPLLSLHSSSTRCFRHAGGVTRP